MAVLKGKYTLTPVDVPKVETEHRRIVTQLPVPESIPIFDKLNSFEPVSMQGQPPIVIHRADSFYVYDKWGNKWIDWSSGVLISNVGNSHPRIREALRQTIDRPLLSTYVFPHEMRAELAELLVATAPEADYRAFILSTGSEATENCIKLAKTYGLEKHGPQKRYIIGFLNGFHGRTMGAQLAGGIPGQQKWLGRPDDSFIHVPFPDGYKNEKTGFDVFLETLQKRGVDGCDVCGVISESYQGVGPDFFPVEYAQKMEAWCREYDVVLIMDEVQAGFGRTGKWYTFEHYGIKPDLIACGKGISSSLPLSAVIGRSDIMNLYGPGSMTSTHSGSPLPIAAAIANIKLLRDGNLIENTRSLEPVLKKGLTEIQQKHPATAGRVQARGLVAGVQIVKPGTKNPDGETALKINERCFQKGLLMFAPVGIAGECIKIAPPLNITAGALNEGLAVLGEAFNEVLAAKTGG